MARYSVSMADAQAVVEMAIGGKAASTFYENERTFDIMVRFQKKFRDDEEKIGNILIPTMNGKQVPLKEIADISFITGPAFIYREGSSRYVGVGFSIRDRDLGSTIAEAQEKVSRDIVLEPENKMVWAGEFESQQRATKRLAVIVPAVLLLILFLLYMNFRTVKDTLIAASSMPYAFIGGIFYEDNQGDFVVITHEKKEVLYAQLQILLWILILSFFIGISAITLFSRWIANRAYRPFRTVIRQVNTISTQNLDKQIKIPNTQDELQDLIITFNKLLAQISETFIIQKNFVSYVSHEFKTPLTSIMGNLEVFSLKDRSPEEYKKLTQTLIQQIKDLEETLNTLLVISDLRNESEISQQVRIDEVIWEIIAKLSQQYRKSNISVNIDIVPENEHLLSVSIEKTQLLIALFNLIENAVKYSQGKTVDILLSSLSDQLSISISDKGIGIPSEQLSSISKPFYRADNSSQIQGSGIGLSIAFRILQKNNILFRIHSAVNEGTIVQLLFPVS